MAKKKVKSNLKNNYFNVITTENGEVAEILLYGYIGEENWWEESDEKDLTDIAFLKAMRKLEAKYDRINVRINSPGGLIFDGNAIINAIKNSPKEIHTYNDGMAASMASGIWLAGHVRHMASNSVMMVHSPSGAAWGNAKNLRTKADMLDVLEKTLIATMKESSSMDEATIKKDFFNYEDHWLTAEDCEKHGFISKIEDYETENDLADIQNMSYADIIAHFQNKKPSEEKSFLKKIKDTITNAITPSKPNPSVPKAEISNTKKHEMNIEELKASIKSGDLKMEDILAEVKAEGYEVTEAKKEEEPAPPAPAPDADPNVAALAEMKKTIEDLQAQVKKLGDGDGDIPTQVKSEKDAPEEPEEPDALAKFNARVEAEIQGGGRGQYGQ